MDRLFSFYFSGGQEDVKSRATPAQLTIMESLETLWIARALRGVSEYYEENVE